MPDNIHGVNLEGELLKWHNFSLDELFTLQSALWHASVVAGISDSYFADVKQLEYSIQLAISDKKKEILNRGN